MLGTVDEDCQQSIRNLRGFTTARNAPSAITKRCSVCDGGITLGKRPPPKPGKDTRVEAEEIYAAYAGECRRLDAPAVSPRDFVDPLKRFCSSCRIYLVNVRLTAPAATVAAE